MDVRRSSPDPERSHEVDFTRGNRDAIARAADAAREFEAAQRARQVEETARAERQRALDQIELRAAERDEVKERAREERVAELKALRERGELNTPARIERAASRLLAGE